MKTLTGTSKETRDQAVAERESEFQKEMKGFEGGATGTALHKNWQEEGSPGTFEGFMGDKYGAGWEAPGGQKGVGGQARAAAANPMAAALAPVAGIGEAKQWWAL